MHNTPLRILISILALAMPNQVLAGPVLIRGGAESETGQGWIFKHGDECLVATAAHVLGTRSGTVITPSGDFGDISSIQFHPDLDLAIASVEGRAKTNCPTESIGYKDSRPLLEDASQKNRSLTLQYVPLCNAGSSECGITNVLVKIDSFSPRDAEFFFYPQGGLIVANLGGDSGSVIRDTLNDGTMAGQPLGIVVRTATRTGEPSTALIFSEIRRMLDSRTSPAAGPKRLRESEIESPSRASGLKLVDFRGDLTGQKCGPLNAISQTSCIFAARPIGRSQVFEIVVEKTEPIPASEFSFHFASGTALPQGIEIAAVDSDYAGFSSAIWTSIRYCRPNTYHFSCKFSPSSAQAFIIRVSGTATIEQISLR